MKFVHQSCINNWVHRQIENRIEEEKKIKIKCEICNQELCLTKLRNKILNKRRCILLSSLLFVFSVLILFLPVYFLLYYIGLIQSEESKHSTVSLVFFGIMAVFFFSLYFFLIVCLIRVVKAKSYENSQYKYQVLDQKNVHLSTGNL